MISLVIISLVVAAFTPIITKKMQVKKAAGTQTPGEIDDETIAELKAKTGDMFLPADAVKGKTQTTADGGYFKCENYTSTIDNAKAVKCKVKIPSDYVSIVMVGAGGGGSGGGNGAIAKNIGIYDTISKRSSNVKLTINNQNNYDSAQGGDLYKIDNETETEYIKNCPENTVEVKTISGNSFCVTKYNLRPTNYEDYHYGYSDKTKNPQSEAMEKEIKVSLGEGRFLVDSKTDSEISYIKKYEMPACWTSSSQSCYGSVNDYTTCNRTVCNWWAANEMCSELDLGENNCSDDGINFNKPCKGRWRLASTDEIASLYDFGSKGHLYSIVGHNLLPLIEGNVKNMLNTCRSAALNNWIMCHASSTGTSGCNGASDNICNPEKVWAESIHEGFAYTFMSGSLSANTTYDKYSGYDKLEQALKEKNAAHSVRCVLHKTKARPVYTYITGGSAGGGATIENLAIPQHIINKCTSSGTCHCQQNIINNTTDKNKNLLLTKGGYGQAKDGIAIDDIEYYIKNEKGEIFWGYKVEGGKAGKGAALRLLETGKFEAIPGIGGEGGKLCYQYDTNLKTWSEPFDCKTETQGTASHGKKGADGIIKILAEKTEGDFYKSVGTIKDCLTGFYQNSILCTSSYLSSTNHSSSSLYSDNFYLGGAGAGGGGGAFAHIKDIPIIPNKEYEIIIGIGGAGTNFVNAGTSNKGINATKGGDTTIYLDNNTIITTKGGGGAGGATSAYVYRTSSYRDGTDAPNAGSKGTFQAVSDSSAIQTILNNKNKTISSSGADGTTGATDNNTYRSIGGFGGASGISIITKIIKNSFSCGGLQKDEIYGCHNENNVDATSPIYLTNLHAPVKHIFIDGNYGSYGTGGSGGGAKYENNEMSAGNGSDGQGGYIYFYWNK